MTGYKQKYIETRKALEDLLSWSTSGKRYQNANPYMILPIKNAMKTLTKIDGHNDYLSLPLKTSDYDNGILEV